MTENRIMEAVLLYTEQAVQYNMNNPFGSRNDRYAMELKMQYYENLVSHFKNRLTKPEKATRIFLKNEIRKLNVQINPSLTNYLLNGRLSRWLLNYVTGHRELILKNKVSISHHQNKIGLEQNFTRLNHAVKQAGFTQDISNILQRMIGKGMHSFHIRYADVRSPNTDFILHFSLIPGTAVYDFEKFDVTSRQTKYQPDNEEERWQTFSLYSETRFTAQEAGHLINGRAISKSGNEWIVLDKTDSLQPFKTVCYNLEPDLKELPLQKVNSVEYKNMLNTLKSGAAKEVVLNINGMQERYRLVAAPNYQTIRVFDANNGGQVDIKWLITQSKRQTEKTAKILSKVTENKVEKTYKRRAG